MPPYATALRAGDINYGDTTVLHKSARLTRITISAQQSRELQAQEISTLLTLTEPRAVADQELELIEVRYQQALAVKNLEDLFAEGVLDWM